MPQPDPRHDRISLCHAPQREHDHHPKDHGRHAGKDRQAPHADQQCHQPGRHDQFPFRAEYVRVSMQRLMYGQRPHHSTAPEKENTELTMDDAKAIKEIPKTTPSSSLKPPEMSSLFMMNMIPQIAIAVIEIHLPAGPVMVFTTRSKGLENSVMPPEAAAISGKRQRHKAGRQKRSQRPLVLFEEGFRCTRMTIN